MPSSDRANDLDGAPALTRTGLLRQLDALGIDLWRRLPRCRARRTCVALTVPDTSAAMARPPPGGKRRSRRLRKKLHVGEFREFGFELALRLDPALADREDAAFWNAFITECVERRGLSYGGASSGFVTRAGRGSVSAEDRDAMRAWIAQRPEIVACTFGPLDDVWYPGHFAADP